MVVSERQQCLGRLGGVEEEEESEEESGEVPGFGTLLRLYLDGCLFGCKCSRLSLFVYLELEFRSQVIISALY